MTAIIFSKDQLESTFKNNDDDHSTMTTVVKSFSSNDSSSKCTTCTSCCSAATISSSTSSISKKSVSFGSIHIRNYNITVSSHPSCVHGPAITFSDDYTDFQHQIPVDTYERIRRNKRSTHEDELYISPMERIHILRLWGVSDEEIKDAQDEKLRIQTNRTETKEMVLKKMKRRDRFVSLFRTSMRRKSMKGTVVTKEQSARRVMICAIES